jgi:competence protein ComEC
VEAVALQSPRWIPAPPPTPLRAIPHGEESELLIEIKAARDGDTMRPASGRAELTVRGRLPQVRAGDGLRIMALASRPAAPLNPGEFDFEGHERMRRVRCRLFAEFPQCIERLGRGSRLSPRRWLADMRSGGVAVLHRHIATERATLASAVLLGAREQLDPHRNEDYLVTGTIHVLSISGLHVGIVAAAFFFVLRLGVVPRHAALAATAGLTVVYALLTDAQPPVLRAAMLVVAVCGALATGRTAAGFNSLALAAVVVLAMNPASLFLAGTQLSFLAVATLIAFAPWLTRQPIVDPLDRLIAVTRPWPVRAAKRLGGGLWRLWLAGALIWIVSTPLVWLQYKLVSPVALVLNFLLWIPITLAMYSGLMTLIIGSWAAPLGRLFGSGCDWSLESIEWLIATGRAWPVSHVWHPAPPGWWVGLFYLVVVVLWVFPRLRPPRRWLVAVVLGWTAGALILPGLTVRRERPLRCTFVAVGHGICVLVELPDGRNLLYDAGRLGSPLTGVRPIASVLWSRGISHLDAIVISHADADHFNAIPGLLERFSAGVVYVSPRMFTRQAPAVAELQAALTSRGAVVRKIFAGQRLAAGSDPRIEVLHPPVLGVRGSDNANSIVLAIEHSGRRILLTGDLETPGLEELLIQESLDCDVVLAPHHGSARSSPSQFADWSRPEHVVVSGSIGLGDRATTQRVKDSFRRAGAEVYHTAEDGCVVVECDSRGLVVKTHRPHVRAGMLGDAAGEFLQTE